VKLRKWGSLRGEPFLKEQEKARLAQILNAAMSALLDWCLSAARAVAPARNVSPVRSSGTEAKPGGPKSGLQQDARKAAQVYPIGWSSAD
jgi:hypothetical protein